MRAILFIYLCFIGLTIVWAEELAFVRTDESGSALCIWNEDSQSPQTIADLPGVCSRLSWSPDGRTLLASVAFEDFQGLWLLETVTGNSKRLATKTACDALDGIYSLDGKWVYYVSVSSEGGSIRRLGLRDGRDEVILDVGAGGGATGQLSWPVFDEKGMSIYYMKDSGWGEWQLWHYNPEKGTEECLIDEACGTPCINDNGSSIWLWQTGDDPALIWIYQYEIDKTEDTLSNGQVFANEAPWQSMPAVRSDGLMIAYVAGPADDSGGKVETESSTTKKEDPYSHPDIWFKASAEANPERMLGDPALGRILPVWRPTQTTH